LALTEQEKRYYGFVKQFPCLNCGNLGSEANHFRGLLDLRTLKTLERSHNGLALYSCFPLCPTCHRLGRESFHNLGERNYIKRLEEKHGEGFVYKYLSSQILTFFLEET
jgi:hypothetical protein